MNAPMRGRPTAEERNEKVRAVLRNALQPMAPTAIAKAICEEWCCYGGVPGGANSAPISQVLKRIGAVGIKGKWVLPSDPAKAKQKVSSNG